MDTYYWDNNKGAAWAEINLSDVLRNLKIVKKYAGKNTDIGAVIKGDAYGLGAKEIVKVLGKEKSVRMFIVGKPLEVEEILPFTNGKPVLILDRITVTDAESIRAEQVVYSAYDMAFMQKLELSGKKENRMFKVHVRMDLWGSGMGFLPGELSEELFSFPHVQVKGIYTHLYSSYQFDWEKSEQELCKFDEVLDRLPGDIRRGLTIHAQNSSLIFTHPNHDYNMARSGAALYGLPCHPENTYGLTPLLSLKSRIVTITKSKENCPLSYQKNKSGRNGEIARFLFGYWDCPFLMTQDNVKVWVKGKLYSVADEPCMDSTCIDVEDGAVSVGDEVVLMGEKEGVRLGEILARHQIDLVHSERLCLLSKRLRRVYTYAEEEL